MSAELELRWLKTQNTKGAVKRFAEFCKEDVKHQAERDDFDLSKYQDAVKLVMRKLDNTYSVHELFSPDKDPSEQQNTEQQRTKKQGTEKQGTEQKSAEQDNLQQEIEQETKEDTRNAD